ncbi:MAG TPA: cupredoxin domain-containing protein [Solirubrobacter sp.]|nr:cupredoxin domain-containing protein [Solirubrobacter sp.]
MNVRTNRILAGAVVAAIGVGGTAAVTAPARPAATYSLSADRSKLKFNKSTIRAKAGRVTLRMSNPSNLPHNIGIKGRKVGRTVGKGKTSTVTVRLRRGTYTFYCGVGNHERAGMRGRLIVR